MIITLDRTGRPNLPHGVGHTLELGSPDGGWEAQRVKAKEGG